MLFKLEAVTVLSLYVHPNESETRVTTGSFQQLQTGAPFLQATAITIKKIFPVPTDPSNNTDAVEEERVASRFEKQFHVEAGVVLARHLQW